VEVPLLDTHSDVNTLCAHFFPDLESAMETPMRRREPAEATINIRATKAKKALIDQAANALGMKRTAFMLEALCEKAHEVLADQTNFQISQQKMTAFNRLIEEPVNEAAIRMLTKRAPWER
jgi:uncharacterized protein (DUF1778 family)